MNSLILEYDFNSFNESLKKEKLIILDFYTNYCMTCKALESILCEVIKYYDNLIIYKVDVTENEYLKYRFNILSVPTLIFIKNGQIINKITSIISKDDLCEFIDKN